MYDEHLRVSLTLRYFPFAMKHLEKLQKRHLTFQVVSPGTILRAGSNFV